MSPEDLDVARKWVAWRGWRWMPGMVCRSEANDEPPVRIVAISDEALYGVPMTGEPTVQRLRRAWLTVPPLLVPDMRDSPTLGIIGELVWEYIGSNERFSVTSFGDLYSPNGPRWRAQWATGSCDASTFAGALLGVVAP
jgi:hypothetical protein